MKMIMATIDTIGLITIVIALVFCIMDNNPSKVNAVCGWMCATLWCVNVIVTRLLEKVY